MRKLFLLIPIIIIGFFVMTGQKSEEPEKWNQPMHTGIYEPGMAKVGPFPQVVDYYNPYSVTRSIKTPIGVLTVTPNIRVLPRTDSWQSEVIICRHPLNQNIMFGSSNAVKLVGGLFISEGVYVTTNGGTNWFGTDTLQGSPVNFHSGDPGPTIDKNGVFIMSHLGSATSSTGMSANYSTNNGLTWSNTVTLATGSQDKNFAGTDDAPLSPFYGRSYVVWSLFNISPQAAAISYTTNSGVSWSTFQQINTPPAGHFAQGCDIRVGPNGEVYVVWAAPISGSPFTEDFLGFAKSTNGGVNWTVTENAFDMNGIRGTFASKSNIRVNSFPRIDVDRSGGSRNGWIYVTTSGRNILPAGSDPDILLYKSTNGGLNWSSGVRVNQDPINNGKFQWFSAIRVDEAGGVNIVYYDDRNTASDSAEVYFSRSIDGGNTFTDALVSDHRHRPMPITGLAGGYQGDYIGITSGNSKLWPIWADNVTGNYQAWTTAVQIATYPLNAFNLQTPPAGTRIVSFPNSNTTSTFTWDTSASTASYKWVFGNPTTTPRKITLTTSTNSLIVTAGQLDNILAGLGLAQGDSLVGQWDVWAFRNTAPDDSLKATNGPRSLTLRRGVPQLSAFNLVSPPNGTTITTSVFNTSTININWTRSGAGVTYKWKFGSPTLTSIRLSLPSNTSGFDTVLTINNNVLDGILQGIGLNPGDSLVGQYAVWAYNSNDSVKSTQTYALTLKRQARGDIILVYDSTIALCRTSRDSVINNLSNLGATFDLFNRGGNAATLGVSFRGYKKVIVLGEGTSVMSNRVKDSLKSYLAAGTTAINSKLIIIAEDVGYHLDRTASTFYDSAFARSTLGFAYIADRIGAGIVGLVGVTTNPNQTDSCAGPFPEVVRRSPSLPQNQLYNLYRHRLYPDSMNSVGRISPTYNVAIMGVDLESLRPAADSPPGSPARRFLKGAMDFVDELITTVSNNTNMIPTEYSLSQNYPNPFNPTTKISFSIPKQGKVMLKIYDVLGKEVMTLVNEQKSAGVYDIEFNASNLASGAYFYRIEAGDFKDIKRMMLIK